MSEYSRGDRAHRRTQELLGLYVTGDLSPEEEGEVARHLEGCAACRAEDRELRLTHERLAGMEAAPPELRSRLLDRLPRRGRRRTGGPMSAAAVVTLFCCALVAILYYSGPLGQEMVASAPLKPTGRAPGASGEVRLYDAGPNMRVRIETRDMPASRPGGYYGLRLMGNGKRVGGGSFTVGPEGRLEADMMVPELPGGYARAEIVSGGAPGDSRPGAKEILGGELHAA